MAEPSNLKPSSSVSHLQEHLPQSAMAGDSKNKAGIADAFKDGTGKDLHHTSDQGKTNNIDYFDFGAMSKKKVTPESYDYSGSNRRIQ